MFWSNFSVGSIRTCKRRWLLKLAYSSCAYEKGLRMADDRVKPVAESANSSRESLGKRLFPLLFGLLLAISLLKFGNPPIMEQWVSPPVDIYEFIFAGPWPITWAYALTASVLLCGLINYKLTRPSVVAVMPGIWLIWQLLASWTS